MAKGVVRFSFVIAALVYFVLGNSVDDVSEEITGRIPLREDLSDVLYKRNGPPHIFSAVKHHSQLNSEVKLHEVPKPTLSSSDVERLRQLLNGVNHRVNGLNNEKAGANSKETDASVGRQERDAHFSSRLHVSRHILDHILDLVKKGHVTSQSMSHWMTLIQSALSHHIISQHDYDDFVKKLTEMTSSDHYDGEACCFFG